MPEPSPGPLEELVAVVSDLTGARATFVDDLTFSHRAVVARLALGDETVIASSSSPKPCSRAGSSSDSTSSPSTSPPTSTVRPGSTANVGAPASRPGGWVDCMIASVANRHDASLLAHDADLNRVARVVGIGLDPASGNS